MKLNGLEKKIQKASLSTPDPQRAQRNLERFFTSAENAEEFIPFLEEMAILFSYSQFLSNYVIKNSRPLMEAFSSIDKSLTKERIKKEAEAISQNVHFSDEDSLMNALRKFKKDVLLKITLRDILKKVDFFESMEELSNLAEVVLQLSLQYAFQVCQQRFGDPSPSNNIAIVALGKLGGYELNYSSDIDILGIYDADPTALTSGILNPSGIRYNRISNQEFYSRVLETLSRLLTSQTEEGICYRLDFRLRPQGQRGALAYSLNACMDYYQTWGRTWERMVLIRARPVAGSDSTSERFREIIDPFVWKSLEYSEIEEIRNMKKRIDSSFSKDDIKRGYGGIREIEFFIHTLQLIYGAEYKQLRTHRLFNALQSLRWLKIIPSDDLSLLWDNYLHLRRIEHYLQMKEDLQTHSLPRDPEELRALAKKLGFKDSNSFLSDLKIRRQQVRTMYHSLLGTEEDIRGEILSIIEGSLSEEELKEYLVFRGLKSSEAGVRALRRLHEKMSLFRTPYERAKLRELIPLFLDEAFRSHDPDRALQGIEEFFTTFGNNRLYIHWFLDQKQFISGVVKIFSTCKYLTRLFLSDSLYMDLLLEEAVIRKSLKHLKAQIHRFTSSIDGFHEHLVDFKKFEEFRVGLFYMMNILRIDDLLRNLSHIAEAVIDEIATRHDPLFNTLIVGMGKLGGREMTYGSDLDLIFVSNTDRGITHAERIIKDLTTYTDRGTLYEVDMRLRPDGSKGTLIKTLKGYRNYYLHHAQPWEIQALLKSRPLRGTIPLRKAFSEMVNTVIRQRADEINQTSIAEMRRRIIQAVSHEGKEELDIKFGPGSLEEIEFYTQYLQAKALKKQNLPVIQNTLYAIKRLRNAGIISKHETEVLLNAYTLLRKVETLLRLNDEKNLQKDTSVAGLIARALGFETADALFDEVVKNREKVLTITDT